MSMTTEQLQALIQQAGLENQAMSAKARRKLPRLPAMVPRGSVILYLILTALISFTVGGVRTAYIYSDEIHGAASAEAMEATGLGE